MKKQSDNFDPRIVVFACNWCSYAGADTAGVSRMQYPPNVRLIRVMCSGSSRSEMSVRTFGHKMSDSPTVGRTYPTYADVKLG